MKDDVKGWILKAEEDLNLVIKLLKDDDAEYYSSSIGFHCEQAIEKYLKAFLVSQKKDFKNTQDLNSLRDLCSEIDPDFSNLDFGNLIELSDDYLFPKEMYVPDIEEIISYKELAINIKFMVESKIEE